MQLSNLYRLIITALFISYLTFTVRASHIVGGEISYRFIEYNTDQTIVTYEVTMKLYRDPVGIDYDAYASFGVFEQETWGAWKSYKAIRNVPLGIVAEVPPDNDPCKDRDLNQERLEVGTYTFELTLEVGNHNYMISYQKCCRNYTINNIEGVGGDIGSVYDIIITPEALRNGNSSPTFNDLPPIFICANYPLNVDNSAIDVDGDELVYKFCPPKFASADTSLPGGCGGQTPDPEICLPPYSSIPYRVPFTDQNPMPGAPQISVDNITGLLSGTPSVTGSFVVAVCIEEYRNGALLTKTRRDFEFNVVECSDNLIAKVFSDNYLKSRTDLPADSIAYFETCDERAFSFINESENQAFIKDYKWQFSNEDNTVVFETSDSDHRDLDYEFEEAGLYSGLMILNDGGTCFDTAYLEVRIVPDIEPQMSITYDTCIAGPVSFQGSSDHFSTADLEWVWNLDNNDIETESSFLYSYNNRGSYDIKVLVTDSYGCTADQAQLLDYYPHELVPPDTIPVFVYLCPQDSVFIYDEWIFSAGIYYNYLPSAFTGCDSLVERIMVEYYNEIPVTLSELTLCEGESYLYNNNWLTETGIYLDTLASAYDCDSIVSLSLDYYDAAYTYQDSQLCPEEDLTFGDQLITQGGSYFDTLATTNGCDSIIELTVTELSLKETYLEDGFCKNSTYIYNGEILTNPGTYEYMFMTSDGCDSLITLELTEHQTYNMDLDIKICEGSYYLFGDEELEEAGEYLKVMTTSEGCDSIITVSLTVLPDTEREMRDTICEGETYAFGELDLFAAGIYFDTIMNSNGCDSLIVLDLEVGENLTRINVEEELELNYGETIILEPEVKGGDLINNEWTEVDMFLSDALVLDYLVHDDEWIYFESTNDLLCVALDSVFIRSILEIDIYFPNIISPDGDGVNDLFNIGASATVASSQLSIYDRWGNPLYIGARTTDRNIESGWDGTYRNEKVAIGTYAYIVEVEFINGETKIYTGDVGVIR